MLASVDTDDYPADYDESPPFTSASLEDTNPYAHQVHLTGDLPSLTCTGESSASHQVTADAIASFDGNKNPEKAIMGESSHSRSASRVTGDVIATFDGNKNPEKTIMGESSHSHSTSRACLGELMEALKLRARQWFGTGTESERVYKFSGAMTVFKDCLTSAFGTESVPESDDLINRVHLALNNFISPSAEDMLVSRFLEIVKDVIDGDSVPVQVAQHVEFQPIFRDIHIDQVHADQVDPQTRRIEFLEAENAWLTAENARLTTEFADADLDLQWYVEEVQRLYAINARR